MRSRHFVAAVAILLGEPTSVQCADKHAWSFYQSPEDARLFYGIAESESITLSFICEHKKHKLVIISTVLPTKLKVGRPALLALRGEAKSASYAGVVAYDAREETFYFEAAAAANPQVFDPLRTGVSLDIKVAGAHETVPLTGLRAPLAKMESACFRK